MSSHTPNILKKILWRKAEEITERAEKISMRELSQKIEHAPSVRGFKAAIKQKLDTNQTAIIAEIKKASPSKGILRNNFSPNLIAQSYEKGGATCLSVLTDHDFFQGNEEYLRLAREVCQLPILRKDFIIDPYQVYESRVIGADCILLIVAALGDALMKELSQLAEHLDMDVLIEVHNHEELERALELNPKMIGINNRNLISFETTLETTINLKPKIPDHCLVVSESGIYSRNDIKKLNQVGVDIFLIGESFMVAEDPGVALTELLYKPN
ncbi:indole-3-glycerol phosphate synthase TrpC [Candidatus Nitrosacidococcus sp. I8]|uniref:indole-3-glycerol phosphate synthase TrpC n=1 Tax=Candidatus Nitrosacidococcus sp. I8 TaxID=2942908 RepID=UPI002227DD4D|nr:indole-3-glycerol phosphate synthase TrpC [Candidatus Nitrosacidococcus sp. I8]CAH9019080.1 Indole-3-glycerol phosphate synthase [Candidatus Nitrosacidococcus sp. I8]